jgi:phosphoribosyl 1,2-cyclic phosphate phosphodiesterase
MKLILLGTGTSHGIPVVGCGCKRCCSVDPRDRRLRSSLYIEGREGGRVVIDTGPEFRLQALAAGLTGLDAILLTHSHADHLHGLDDVRPLSRNRPIPVYGNEQTIRELEERFSYIFHPVQIGGGLPQIECRRVSAPFGAGGLRFTPVPVKHGNLDILGWAIREVSAKGGPKDGAKGGHGEESCRPGNPLAVYLTDTSAIPDESLPLVKNPGVLIIGALRQRPHPTHFNFDEALEAALRMGAKRIYLTHICHDYTHEEISAYCGNFLKNHDGVSAAPAWDGLELEL